MGRLMEKTYTEVSADKVIELCNQRKSALVYDVQGEIEEHIKRNEGNKIGGMFSFSKNLRTRQSLIDDIRIPEQWERNVLDLIAGHILRKIDNVESIKTLATLSSSGIVYLTLEDLHAIA